MKKSLCGANCAECPSKNACQGCAETKGCPFGKQCFFAKYILVGGKEKFADFKKKLIDEINALEICGMPKVDELYPLVGKFVNLEYPLENGNVVKLLKDDEMYFGTQLESEFSADEGMCFGVIARENFILICEYGEKCTNPEIVLYKRR